MAPSISGPGQLSAQAGHSPCGGAGALGRIRLEAFQFDLTGTLEPAPTFGTPIPITQSPLVPTNVPTLRVVRVGGQTVSANPRGTFVTPDVTINAASTATVEVEAAQVPPGTIVQLTIYSEDGTTQTVETTPLAGTMEFSTALGQVTFQHGFSGINIQASFAPQ